MNSPSVRAGIVGLGYWGPNIARNLAAIPGCELTWCCERSSEAREAVANRFPRARMTAEIEDLLADPELDAVALATPVATHAELAVKVGALPIMDRCR